jgi:glycosyltransferase involved in cell wall biosynthesis
MRVLFISGTDAGGAARSTHELAAVLAARGHDVATVMRRDDEAFWTYFHRRGVNLRVKLGTRRAAKTVDTIVRRIGARLRPDPVSRSYPSFLAIRPENAMPAAVARIRPEVVIVNSIDLPAWRQLRHDLEARGLPVVLYLREETGLLHLSHSKVPPDLLIANATGHVEAARDLGYDATLIPSVVDCSTCTVETTRERVLLVNPTYMYGVDVALELAARRPDIPFTFAESITLDADEYAAVEQRGEALGNVDVRRFTPSLQALYADVRILLAPYRYPGRSRVIAEAQCSGIPTLGSDRYGLAEAIGDAGIVLDPDASVDQWERGLAAMWDDHERYTQLCEQARARSVAEDRRPDAIAARLEAVLDGLVHHQAG